MSTIYINRKDSNTGQRETVDETDSKKDAEYLLGEYQLSDSAGTYYKSCRACEGWD